MTSEKQKQLLSIYGVKFGIYKNGIFKEQLFPFDPIPRGIEKEELTWYVLEKLKLKNGYILWGYLNTNLRFMVKLILWLSVNGELRAWR